MKDDWQCYRELSSTRFSVQSQASSVVQQMAVCRLFTGQREVAFGLVPTPVGQCPSPYKLSLHLALIICLSRAERAAWPMKLDLPSLYRTRSRLHCITGRKLELPPPCHTCSVAKLEGLILPGCPSGFIHEH